MTDATPDRYMEAAEMMDDILANLEGYPDDVKLAATGLAEVVGAADSGVEWAGPRMPGVIATSCIYVADYAIRGEDRVTQERLCEMAPGSHPTVREYYRDIPEVFFRHATEDDRNDLAAVDVEFNGGTNVLDVLCVFRDAERAGIGIRNIELDADPDAVRDLADSLAEVQG